MRKLNDEGAAGVEYGILVAAIATAMIVLSFTVGDYVAGAFDTVVDEMKANGVPSQPD